MRAIKTTTISILAVGLLAGSAVGVAAQDESAGASNLTGTIASGSDVSQGTRTEVEGLVLTSGVVGLGRWDAPDERLSGDATYTGNWLYDERERTSIRSATYELSNDGGSWLGEATALATPSLDTDTVLFTGRGGYEGLTAYVLIDWSRPATEFTGVVFPAPMPETPEPYVAE